MLGFREDTAFFGAMTQAFCILIQSSGVGQSGACCLPDGHLESSLAFNPTVSIPDSTHLPEKLPKFRISAKGEREILVNFYLNKLSFEMLCYCRLEMLHILQYLASTIKRSSLFCGYRGSFHIHFSIFMKRQVYFNMKREIF